jgi:hypothetical protein
MKAGHSKLDGYGATLPARKLSPRLPTVVAPLPPPPAWLLCAHTYVLLPTAEPPQIPASQDGAQESRAVDIPAAAPPLPSPSPCEKLHGLIPRPDPLLNRLAADPPPLSPAYTAPLVSTSTAPAISWLSEPLPPACKVGKTLLLDGFKLSSMAVLCLLGFEWGKNTSHRKWHYKTRGYWRKSNVVLL